MQICIASNVSSQFIIDDFEKYKKMISKRFTDDDLFYCEIGLIELLNLESILFNEINELILNKPDVKSPNSVIKFNNIELSLNFTVDFEICSKVNLYNLSKDTVNKKGTLYVFKRSFISNLSLSVIALIRYRPGSDFDYIRSHIMKLPMPFYPSDIELKSELNSLINLGLLDINQNKNEYVVNGLGYIFR